MEKTCKESSVCMSNIPDTQHESEIVKPSVSQSMNTSNEQHELVHIPSQDVSGICIAPGSIPCEPASGGSTKQLDYVSNLNEDIARVDLPPVPPSITSESNLSDISTVIMSEMAKLANTPNIESKDDIQGIVAVIANMFKQLGNAKVVQEGIEKAKENPETFIKCTEECARNGCKHTQSKIFMIMKDDITTVGENTSPEITAMMENALGFFTASMAETKELDTEESDDTGAEDAMRIIKEISTLNTDIAIRRRRRRAERFAVEEVTESPSTEESTNKEGST